ncbi:hypothetical protein [Deinococcus ruber]|uniref:hypothetical protein n=1 Tax=Deinococcus ruber TaxID=1848197 RepID=UPI001668F642|nr:hypothetical protein [Deinococcus ruber]
MKAIVLARASQEPTGTTDVPRQMYSVACFFNAELQQKLPDERKAKLIAEK